MRQITLIGLAWWLGWIMPAPAQGLEEGRETVYVSPQGNDKTGDGTEASPFYSLNRAVEGRLSSGSSSDTLFLRVASGAYYMQEPFVIRSPLARPLVIQSQGEEKPRLLGGIRIDGWEACGDGMYRAYVPEVARYGLDFEQFYVNDRRAILARTPNTEWFFVKGTSEHPFVKGVRSADYAVQQVDFHPADWETLLHVPSRELKHLKFRFYHKWDITTRSPRYVEKDSCRIYMEGQGMKPWNPIQQGSRYYMYDYKAALDSPGEWFLDREKALIYYMPREGERMEEAVCIAPVLEHWVIVQGEEGKPVKDVTFENLSFQYSAYHLPPEGEEPAQASANAKASMQFDFADRIRLENCEMLHTGAYAVWFGQECNDNRVSHCYLYDLGAGGIKVGEPYFRTSGRPVTRGNVIDNNIITHTGRELPCGVGIALFHTADNQVTHNEISDLLYSGISIGWVWGYNQSETLWTNAMDDKGEMVPFQKKLESPAVGNKVMYNHIHHIGWGELSDMGAVYTLGESPGTCVSHNVIHDVYSYDYGGWGLYTDEGSTGVEMSYNLVYRCKSGGFHQHYGKENRIFNNILAFAYTNQLQCTRKEEHQSFVFRHNIVLIEDEVLFRGQWENADIDADRNLYWSLSGKQDFFGKDFKAWKKAKEPHSVWADPLFKDPKRDDFTFQSHAGIRKIGFKPFDYSHVGVYGEEEWVRKARLTQEREDEFTRLINRLTAK